MDNKCVHVGRYVQTPDIFLASPSPIFSGSVSSILLVRKLMSMGSAGLEGGQDLLSTTSVESLHLSFDAV